MKTIIDAGSELLIDTSSIRDPYVRLVIAAVGQDLVRGSPWVVVNKQLAVLCNLPLANDSANRAIQKGRGQGQKGMPHAQGKSLCQKCLFSPSEAEQGSRLTVSAARVGPCRPTLASRRDRFN